MAKHLWRVFTWMIAQPKLSSGMGEYSASRLIWSSAQRFKVHKEHAAAVSEAKDKVRNRNGRNWRNWRNWSDNIRLTWGDPNCGKCESEGGRCRLKSNSSNQIDCQISPRHRLPKGARYAIIIGAGIPAFLFFNALVCFLLRRIRVCWRRGRPEAEFTLTIVAPPRPVMITGLDEPTIASYPRTVVGESRRLPNPEYNVCPICLSEYLPNDTLRTIPACQHCFHADCIDEWLRLNASCPVCRNFPKSSGPVHVL